MNKLSLLSLFSMVLVSSCVTISRIDKKDSRNNQFSKELQNFMAVKHPQKIDTTVQQSKSDTTWGPLIPIYHNLDSSYLSNYKEDTFTVNLWDTTRNYVFRPYGAEKYWKFVPLKAIGDYHKHINSDGSVWYDNLLYPIDLNGDTIIPSWKLDTTGFYTGGDPSDTSGHGEYDPRPIVCDDTTFFHVGKLSHILISSSTGTANYIRYAYIHDTTKIGYINQSEVNALASYLKSSRDSTSMFQLKYSQSKSSGLIKLFISIGLGLLLIAGIVLYVQKK